MTARNNPYLLFTTFCLWSTILGSLADEQNACVSKSQSQILIVQYRDSATTCTIRSSKSCIGDREIVTGHELPLQLFGGERQRPPELKFSHAEEDLYYTVMMVDPDAASRAPCLYWLHWLVVNIPGLSLITGNIDGDTKTAYAPPTPPKGTGLHRYEFYLFPQRRFLRAVKTSSNRANFNIPEFQNKYDLDDPVAENEFKTGQ